MEKQNIIDYVMETPGNSNPAVLGSLLNQFSEEIGDWTNIKNKPFETIGAGLEVNNSQLKTSLPLTHETWTFTLEDDTTVTKEVVLWNSQE